MSFSNIVIVVISVLLGIILAEVTEAANCSNHPIYCQIKILKPKLSDKKAMKLSNLFYKAARKHKIKDTLRSVAIAMQETSLNPLRSRVQNVIVFEGDNWKVVRGYSDICMFQFHVNTIVHEGIDPVKLKTDINYCVDQHFKLLKKKIKMCKHLGNEAWTCYHSKTLRLRKRYKQDVERYY